MVARDRRDDSNGQSHSTRRRALAGHTVRARLWRDYLRNRGAGDSVRDSAARGGKFKIISNRIVWEPVLAMSCDQRFIICSARFSTLSAASLTASLRVGCEWQVRPISSELPPNSITDTASAISSDAA